jgi:hypothetical protein
VTILVHQRANTGTDWERYKKMYVQSSSLQTLDAEPEFVANARSIIYDNVVEASRAPTVKARCLYSPSLFSGLFWAAITTA